MRYLIAPKEGTPFLTDWFEADNDYIPGSVVYDLRRFQFTVDGKVWQDIIIDNL